MKLYSYLTAASGFLAMAPAMGNTFSRQEIDPRLITDTTCFDYTEAFDLGPKDCNKWILYERIRAEYDEQSQAEGAESCSGGINREIMTMTQTTEWGAMVQALQDLCDDALKDAKDQVPDDSWGFLENEPHAIDLEKYFEGGGFLNNEEGNLYQEEDDFIKHGGHKRFVYIGDDPRKNDYIRTTDNSYKGGKAIMKFYEEKSETSFLSAPTLGFQSGCQASNAVVCCWNRDRQYFDNNGHCHFPHCKNVNPGDNTDLCFIESEGEVYPYPGEETEEDLHCHGFAWPNNEEDINNIAKWNILFYVSMYDHLLLRGYVNSITDDPKIEGEQPMCGCVEDMNPVARADCTEVIARTNYTAYQDKETGLFVVEHKPNTFELEFKACEGYDYIKDLSPEEFAGTDISPHDLGLERSHNDLAGYVFRQYLEGKIDEDQVSTIEDTIIGYRDPSVNDGDEEREAACEAAFKKRYPNKGWVEQGLISIE